MIAIERQLEIVTQQIIRARIFYDLWRLYRGADTRSEIVDTLDDFSEFFRFDEHAQFVSMVVHCGVIWDKSNISLPSVANRILDCRRHGEDKTLKQEIDSFNSIAKGILIIRNEAIAHRSANFDYDEAFHRAEVMPDQIQSMLEKSLEFTNQLRRRKEMEEVVFAELPLEHLQQLIVRLGGPELAPKTRLDEIFEA